MGLYIFIHLLDADTAGQERFRAITKTFYKNAKVVIIVFDLTNKESFDNIDLWIKEIEKEGLIDPIIMLVGNKVDLKSKRQVSKEDIIKKTLHLKLHGYFESSAKENIFIDDIFMNIVKIYVSLNYLMKNINNDKDIYIGDMNPHKKLKKKINITTSSSCTFCYL